MTPWKYIKKGVEKSNSRQRLLNKPPWVTNVETKIATAIPLHPNIISALKLVIIVPLLILALKQLGTLPHYQGLVVSLYIVFCILDYLDGTVARYKKLTTVFGGIFDRITDFPVLLTVSLFCLKVLPPTLLAAKLILDFILIILYLIGRGSPEGRFRTGINYTTLFALIIVSQGWASKLINPEVVVYLLWLNITFSGLIVLFNLSVLQKRFIADALSGVNLLCGLFSIYFAYKGKMEICLLFLMLGAAFDGFDGAAARKFGSTRWGVYSDDVADGVNYGIAPAFALYFAIGGLEGIAIGISYVVFTIGRLIYFTLNKANSDPNFFCGVPSTIGGLITICSLILFKEYPVMLGFMVGIACIQMISFDTLYRHVGRALSSNRRIIYGMPFLIILLVGGHFFIVKEFPIAVILAASLIYGAIPTLTHFVRILKKNNE
ncbi:MAG: hypothetical protein GY757_41595 [bacterium]|nr:hypothetical protein [bacterium]